MEDTRIEILYSFLWKYKWPHIFLFKFYSINAFKRINVLLIVNNITQDIYLHDRFSIQIIGYWVPPHLQSTSSYRILAIQQLPVLQNELISLSFNSITGFTIFTRTEETVVQDRIATERVLFTCASHRRFSAPDKWPHLRTKFYPARPFIHTLMYTRKEQVDL